MPHLQVAGLRIQDLTAGKYPQGGDASWDAAVKEAIGGWREKISAAA